MIVFAGIRPLRIAAVLATVSAAVLMAGLDRAQTVAAPAGESLAPSGGAPAITLPAKVVQAASVYRAYVDRAAGISPDFADGAQVAASLRAGESYEVQQMQRGITAYAAIVALQDPTFVAAVRTFGVDPTQRAQVADMLLQDPRYAIAFHGADSAAGLIIAALSDQGQRVLEAGRKVKQAAYDVQHQKWSKDFVPNRDERLALAKSLSAAEAPPSHYEADLRAASTGAAPMSIAGQPVQPPYSATIVRALAIAALAALGDGGEDHSDQLVSLLVEPGSNECLNMSKLNLYQCLAVSKPHYEDVFCLGQHVLMDTGECILKVAGLSPPPPPVAEPAIPVKTVVSRKVVSKKKVAAHAKKKTSATS